MHAISYIQCMQFFDVWTFFFTNCWECKVCIFNIQTFQECQKLCIFNVHNFSKNVHNFVYSIYKNFKTMYTIMYV